MRKILGKGNCYTAKWCIEYCLKYIWCQSVVTDHIWVLVFACIISIQIFNKHSYLITQLLDTDITTVVVKHCADRSVHVNSNFSLPKKKNKYLGYGYDQNSSFQHLIRCSVSSDVNKIVTGGGKKCHGVEKFNIYSRPKNE